MGGGRVGDYGFLLIGRGNGRNRDMFTLGPKELVVVRVDGLELQMRRWK